MPNPRWVFEILRRRRVFKPKCLKGFNLPSDWIREGRKGVLRAKKKEKEKNVEGNGYFLNKLLKISLTWLL